MHRSSRNSKGSNGLVLNAIARNTWKERLNSERCIGAGSRDAAESKAAMHARIMSLYDQRPTSAPNLAGVSHSAR
jgi:hypothetical protein